MDHIINIGPIQINFETSPESKIGRHFSKRYYSKKLPNGGTILRRWLVYCTSNDSMFCFCCRLFDNNLKYNLLSEGYSNWRKFSETLTIHKNSASHILSVIRNGWTLN